MKSPMAISRDDFIGLLQNVYWNLDIIFTTKISNQLFLQNIFQNSSTLDV